MRLTLRWSILLFFLLNSVCYGGNTVDHETTLTLPKPGEMVQLSPAFIPMNLKGIKVFVKDPLRFEFIIDQGSKKINDPSHDAAFIAQANNLIRYFAAAMTTPEGDMWVNLSPYEKDRIVEDHFGRTALGRDLLAQDYILKQLSASLVYPLGEIGKKFWKRVYELSRDRIDARGSEGTAATRSLVDMRMFHKVWIVPDKALVYENVKTGTAYISAATLKVLSEQDYLAESKARGAAKNEGIRRDAVSTGALREIVIPQLTKEVNEGVNFAQLRQIYNSIILAVWYKKKIKNALLSQVFVNQHKVDGIRIKDLQEKEKIYQRYLQAFKKGVYNYIQEDIDDVSGKVIPRKYFSGGASFLTVDRAMAFQAVEGFYEKTVALPRVGEEATRVVAVINPNYHGTPSEDGNGRVIAVKFRDAVASSAGSIHARLPQDHITEMMMSFKQGEVSRDHLNSLGFNSTRELFEWLEASIKDHPRIKSQIEKLKNSSEPPQTGSTSLFRENGFISRFYGVKETLIADGAFGPDSGFDTPTQIRVAKEMSKRERERINIMARRKMGGIVPPFMLFDDQGEQLLVVALVQTITDGLIAQKGRLFVDDFVGVIEEEIKRGLFDRDSKISNVGYAIGPDHEVTGRLVSLDWGEVMTIEALRSANAKWRARYFADAVRILFGVRDRLNRISVKPGFIGGSLGEYYEERLFSLLNINPSDRKIFWNTEIPGKERTLSNAAWMRECNVKGPILERAVLGYHVTDTSDHWVLPLVGGEFDSQIRFSLIRRLHEQKIRLARQQGKMSDGSTAQGQGDNGMKGGIDFNDVSVPLQSLGKEQIGVTIDPLVLQQLKESTSFTPVIEKINDRVSVKEFFSGIK